MRTVKEIKQTINEELKACGFTYKDIHYVQAQTDSYEGGSVHVLVSVPMDKLYIHVAEGFNEKLARATSTKLIKLFGSVRVKEPEIEEYI